jgi:hypothetical protein
MPMFGGGYGNGFGMDGSWIWIIVLLAIFGGFGNGFGGFGGFGGGGLADGGLLGYAIGNNATKGDLSSGLTNVQNGSKLDNISTQLCNGFAGVNATVNSGFANAESSANARQIANMQTAFNSQVAITDAITDLASQQAQCLKKVLNKAKELLCFTKCKTVGTLAA